MSMFASTPTIDGDPYPWVHPSSRGEFQSRWAVKDPYHNVLAVNRYAPRPEMRIPNPKANPILVNFRANIGEAKRLIADGVDIDMLTLLGLWRLNLTAMETFGGHVAWNDITHPMHFLTKTTEAQVEHASEVIDRLYDLQVMAHV